MNVGSSVRLSEAKSTPSGAAQAINWAMGVLLEAEKAEIIKKIRSFYAKDRGRAIESELIRLMGERLFPVGSESFISAH